MKARIKHIYEIIAGAILSLLGFNGCDENIFIGPVEYGMPHATFEVKGTVKAEDTGESVKGIKVKLRHYTEETRGTQDGYLLHLRMLTENPSHGLGEDTWLIS